MPAGRLLYLHAISPLHTGTGQSAALIDLPVAREKATNWPYVPGSAIKGVLRDACGADAGDDGKTYRKDDAFFRAFGPPTDHASEGSGSLWFTDLHLLCLPVRTLVGTFAWVTSPLALLRWRRDHLAAGLAEPALDHARLLAVAGDAGSASWHFVVGDKENQRLAYGDHVFLEDLDLPLTTEAGVADVAEVIAATLFPATAGVDPWRGQFRQRFGVVPDPVFTFLAETATEVIARVKLKDETKTVQRGGLWYEEAVPAEAIFAGPIVAAPRVQNAAALFKVIEDKSGGVHQVGGGASVGRGLVRLRLKG